MPQCPFCLTKHKSKRGEHVLPKWMSKAFPDATWLVTNRLTGYVRKSEKYINIKTPLPCKTCNSVWMSQLEQLAKPVLLPLIHGNASVLTFHDQITIVTWMFKTAAMFDLHAAERAPRPRYFEPHELRLFGTTLGFSPSYSIYVGKYAGTNAFRLQETHSDVKLVDRRNGVGGGDSIWGYALTIVVERLVLQIFCAKVPMPLPFNVNAFKPFSYQIGVEPHDIQWPPPLSFADPLIEEFVHRWASEPPP